MYNFGYLVSDALRTSMAAIFTKFCKCLHKFQEQNDSIYTKLPDLFFLLQTGKIADIFPKKISLK